MIIPGKFNVDIPKEVQTSSKDFLGYCHNGCNVLHCWGKPSHSYYIHCQLLIQSSFPISFMYFMTLTFLQSLRPVSPCVWNQVTHFWQEWHIRDVPFPVRHGRRHARPCVPLLMLQILITGHSESVSFLHILFFSFLSLKCRGRQAFSVKGQIIHILGFAGRKRSLSHILSFPPTA